MCFRWRSEQQRVNAKTLVLGGMLQVWATSQPAITCWKLTMETSEQCVYSVESQKQRLYASIINVVLLFILLLWNRFQILFLCFNSCLEQVNAGCFITILRFWVETFWKEFNALKKQASWFLYRIQVCRHFHSKVF